MEGRRLSSPRVMVAYAVFLLACGFAAFALSGFDFQHGKTSLLVPGACAVVMLVCAALAASHRLGRGAVMAGIHIGLVFPLVVAAAVGWRAYNAWLKVGTPEGLPYLAVILSLIAVGSLVFFVLILRTRPPKDARA